MGKHPSAGFQGINIIQINPPKSGSEDAKPKNNCFICKAAWVIAFAAFLVFIGYRIGVWRGLIDPCCGRALIIDCCAFDFEIKARSALALE